MGLSWPTLPIYHLFNETVSIPRYTESKRIKHLRYIIKNYGHTNLYRSLYLTVT